MSGQITVFTTPGCSRCERVKALLTEAGAAQLNEITVGDDWRPLVFLLTGDTSSLPQVFFNASYMGSVDEIEHLATADELAGAVRDCLSESDPQQFPPKLYTPDPTEYFQLVPTQQREVWQSYIDELCSTLSKPDKQVELVMVMMDTPVNKMVVVCTAGAASAQFKVGGAGADKKDSRTKEKLYCQMVMEERKTFFFNGASSLPSDLSQNVDLVKYGFSYYIGAPWRVGDLRGTIVTLEKEAGILREEHIPIIEKVRDKIEKEWKEFLFITVD